METGKTGKFSFFVLDFVVQRKNRFFLQKNYFLWQSVSVARRGPGVEGGRYLNSVTI
jgi:hypothetical protein